MIWIGDSSHPQSDVVEDMVECNLALTFQVFSWPAYIFVMPKDVNCDRKYEFFVGLRDLPDHLGQ